MCNLNCILVPWAVSNLTNIMGLKGFKTMCKKYNDYTNLTSIKKWRFSKKGNEKKDSWCHREWKKFASFLNNLFFTLVLALETIWQFSCNHGFRSGADACLANGIYLCALHTPTYYEAHTVLHTTFPHPPHPKPTCYANFDCKGGGGGGRRRGGGFSSKKRWRHWLSRQTQILC